MSISGNKKNNEDSGFFDGLGSIYGSVKDTVWGKPAYSLTKNSEGVYNADLWGPGGTAKGWQSFTDKGGQIGDAGELLNADGSPFDMSSIGADLKGLSSTTEGGLGSLLSSDSLKTAGEYAGNLGKVFGMYQAADNIFGSGAKSRKAAERRLEEGFKQNYAMNQMAMDKFKEDNAHFKQQRAAITSSYNA